MNSWLSKTSVCLLLAGTCGTMTSCQTMGKYARQTEVRTDVPESLEKGQPSKGPADAYAAGAAVPPGSDLMDIPESAFVSVTPSPMPENDLPGARSRGVAPGQGLMELPPPDFTGMPTSVQGENLLPEIPTRGAPVTMASASKTRETHGVSQPAAAPSETGVPLLASGGRLGSFYRNLHRDIIDTGLAEYRDTVSSSTGVDTASFSLPR